MKFRLGLCFLFFSLAAATLLGGDPEVLYIPEKISYAEGMRVPANIQTECGLEVQVADDIAHQAGNVYKKVVRQKPESGEYHELDVEISSVFGAGGGGWSGPKNLELRGKLKTQSGKLLGSFSAERYSTGGAFGGMMGTCKILKRCSRKLGEDVAQFLVDPVENARLGN